MKLALKVDVNTYRGTRDGVPRLIDILKARGAGATFLFTLGPDRSGRAISHLFRPGVFSRAWRNQIVRSYGLRTLFYGTLLPAPDIGAECAGIMRGARDAGFEVGIRAYERVLWQQRAAGADAEWTRRQMDLACARFVEIFGEPARVHGAAGWQMNLHAYRLTQRLAFDYCSDTRGKRPFVPIYNAEIIACPQLPTTLPTLDELIGVDGLTADTVADHVLQLSRTGPPSGHVYTLHAELEGMKLAPAFERLLAGWRAAGCELVSLRDYFAALEPKALPRHVVTADEFPGRSGTLASQGREFLADSDC
jgi:peptidoglycan/xylan/chitin deacetylase (PgdA/CDA1 family)